ncbi:hypothetical protein FKW15_10175, partial [Acetobacter sp. DmW_125133]
ILPGLLKSQSKNQDKEPEITHKSTQSKVFRTLQMVMNADTLLHTLQCQKHLFIFHNKIYYFIFSLFL